MFIYFKNNNKPIDVLIEITCLMNNNYTFQSKKKKKKKKKLLKRVALFYTFANLFKVWL